MDSIVIEPKFYKLIHADLENFIISDYNYERNPYDRILEEQKQIDLEKKIKKWHNRLTNTKLVKYHKIRKICLDNQDETSYCWNSDPSRQKECYDKGEVDESNKEFAKIAVRRIFHDDQWVLVRVTTGNPVGWSEDKGKWIDIPVEDNDVLRRNRRIISDEDPKGGYSE